MPSWRGWGGSTRRERAKRRFARRGPPGYDNLSFDLMFWLPGQSLASWLRTVDEAIALAPDHLSLYLLELYPNAPLKEAMARRSRSVRRRAELSERQPWAQAPDDEAADMYLAALERLDRAGYEQYEISNVARPGYSSRHNVKYWQGGAWRGFGCGAHSTVDGVRWNNVASTHRVRGARLAHGRSVDRGPSAALAAGPARGSAVHGAPADRRDRLPEHPRRHGVEPWIRYRAGPRALRRAKA